MPLSGAAPPINPAGEPRDPLRLSVLAIPVSRKKDVLVRVFCHRDKHHDPKQLEEEGIYFSSHFQVTHHL